MFVEQLIPELITYLISTLSHMNTYCLTHELIS